MLPKPPTDNLYKFVAVTGLALAAFCFVFPNQQSDSLSSKIDANATELLEFESRLNDLEGSGIQIRSDEHASPYRAIVATKQEYADYHCAIDKLGSDLVDAETLSGKWAKNAYFANTKVRESLKRTKGFTDSQFDAWVNAMTVDEYQKLMEPYRTLAKTLRHDLFKHIGLLEATWKFSERVEQYAKWAQRGIWFGLGVALLGFACWYFKLQRHQDALLRKQLDEAAGATRDQEDTNARAEEPEGETQDGLQGGEDFGEEPSAV